MAWNPLPAFPGLPTLLVSGSFTPSSYTIHITDLVNVWVESLDQTQIRERSLAEDTSIDLSAGDDQWAVFMSKLSQALDSAASDHPLTSLSLALDSPASSEGALLLRITCALPAPLQPLKWPVKLGKCSPTSIASELVLPLIHAHHLQTLQINDLAGQLKAKDAIIDKFIEKLAATGTGIENVFTSLSAKHTVSRSVAEQKIKGLAPFHQAQWTSNPPPCDTQNTLALIQTVFGGQDLHCQLPTHHQAPNALTDHWWARLNHAVHTKDARARHASLSKESRKPYSANGDSSDEEVQEFQVQTTPPNVSSPPSTRGKTSATKDEANSTESEDSEIVPDSHPVQSPSKPRPKIGALGNRRRAAPNPSASQSSHTMPLAQDETASDSNSEGEPFSHARITQSKSKKSMSTETKAPLPVRPSVDIGDETASGSGSDSDLDSDQPFKSVPVARIGELGRIGGKAKPTTESSQRKSTPPVKPEDKDEASTNMKTRKIGAIGKRPRVESTLVSSNNPAPPPEPETDEQKAERKRAELAKELERTRTAARTKKKRKF
ncbi:XLF-domain-containing protein [Xylariaceae sp. FL0255]|nr:XLF-domain-containing protein [Xylariaceae sp. FL0255]